MTEIPKEESKTDRGEIVKLEARISILERKNKRILNLIENTLVSSKGFHAELKTLKSITMWMFNETVGRVGKHIPEEIQKLVDGG